jgi:TP901 family phage tail tape measure protein
MKPELADNAQALIAATEASLNLANAQGTDVATAADIVVRALNVYNSSARQAARYTNVLAAGCKNGSGDIEWLGTAFGKAGATAKAVGMTYEETITTLELLSRRIKDATSAGS